MNYLSTSELIAIHELLLAEFGGIRGITEAGFGRLEAAVYAPQQSMFGTDLYPDLASKAAALTHSIIQNHPFSDGNKRVAVVALTEMLARNNARLQASDDEVYTMAMATASSLDRQTLARWVAEHIGRQEAECNGQRATGDT